MKFWNILEGLFTRLHLKHLKMWAGGHWDELMIEEQFRIVGVTTCPAFKDSCKCYMALHHFGPHVCECGGAWDNEGKVVAWPEGGGMLSALIPLPQPGAKWRQLSDGVFVRNDEA